jgi:hypothetical protein
MKTILVLGLVASILTAAPAFAVTQGADGLCGPDAPESYKRPGGYCEMLQLSGSLSQPLGGGTLEAGLVPEGEDPDPCAVACTK